MDPQTSKKPLHQNPVSEASSTPPPLPTPFSHSPHLRAAAGLVQHDPAVWEAPSVPRLPRGQEEGRHGGCLAHRQRGDGAANVLHGVVDGQPCGNHTPRGVDVHADLYREIRMRAECGEGLANCIEGGARSCSHSSRCRQGISPRPELLPSSSCTHRLLGVLRLQVQELGNDEIGARVLDGPVHAHDALPQEAGVDVEGPLAPRGGFYYHWHQGIRPQGTQQGPLLQGAGGRDGFTG